MKKWDYKFIKVTLPIASGLSIQSDGTTQSEQMIKEFGEDGWELVSVTILSELHYELERFEESGKSRTYDCLLYTSPSPRD